MAPLIELDRDWHQAEAIILGSGGAARAVIAGCEQLGFRKIRIVGRDRTKLLAIQDQFLDAAYPDRIEVHLWDQVHSVLPQAQLIVNTTPVGMAPQIDATPLNEEAIALLPFNAIVYDLIYTPQPTKLLAIATHQGKVAIDGLEMLVQQGAAALKIWLGAQPNLDIMRQSAHTILGFKQT